MFVSLTCRQNSTVSQVIGRKKMPFTITAKATARLESNGCVLALGDTNAMGVPVWGSTNFTANDCTVMSNTGGPTSVAVGGAGTLNAECVYAVGGIQTNAGLTTECSAVVPFTAPAADPYADITIPSSVSSMPCVQPIENKATKTMYFPSGRYCGNNNGTDKTYSIKDNGVFEPNGTFYFDNATLNLQSNNANVIGTGVTMNFLNQGTINTANGVYLNLSAKTSGPIAGVLMYADRNTGPAAISIQGNQTSVLQGALYFPNTTLTYRGGAGIAGGCTQIIAETVDFSGNSSVDSNCESAGTRTFRPPAEVYLVY